MDRPQVLIIASGSSSRLAPVNDVPKGMVSLWGKPLLIWLLLQLEAQGFHDVVITLPPDEKWPQWLDSEISKSGLKLRPQIVVQARADGMGDAVLAAQSILRDQFILLFPYHFNAIETVLELIKGDFKPTICITRTSQPHQYGIVKLAGDQIIDVVEKPEPGTEPSDSKLQGLYYLDQQFLQILEKVKPHPYSFETALAKYLKVATVKSHRLDTSLPSLKYPWHLFDIFDSLSTKHQTTISPQASLAVTAILDDSGGPIVVEAGVTIGHASRIVGPCYIGENSVVGDFSLIRSSCLGAQVKVGAFAEVARSLIFTGSSFHGSGFIGDSIIGEQVKIGAGFITANKRFDRQSVKVTNDKNEITDTHRHNLGIIIGSHTKIGISVNSMPGTVIPPETVIFPNQHLKGSLL